MIPHEPLASIVREVYEGFASGRFETQGEVKRFLEQFPEIPKDFPDGTIRYERVIRLLNRIVYTGYLEIPDWDIPLRKTNHPPLISLKTFEAVQTRIRTMAKAPARMDISADFPLRGFVTYGDCEKPLTANWSKSKTGEKHPYYMCFNKACESHRKSIRRDTLETQFGEVLDQLQPSDSLFALAKAMFKNIWAARIGQAEERLRALRLESKALDKKIEGLLDRIVDASTPSVIAAYEKRLAQLERDKLIIAEKQAISAGPANSFDEMFELA